MSSIAKRTSSLPTIGHVVEAPRGYVADDAAAYLELLKGTVGVHQVAREDPSMEANGKFDDEPA